MIKARVLLKWSTWGYIAGLFICLLATLVFGRMFIQSGGSRVWLVVLVPACLVLAKFILDAFGVLRGF